MANTKDLVITIIFMNRSEMGSLIEINDTLQLTSEQGFPAELDIDRHMQDPYKVENFFGKVFEFHSKPKIRVYQQSPVRVFLVENRDGKWIYWGLAHITEVTHDYLNKTTSGRFKLVYIYTPDEMKKAHELVDRDAKTNYFGN